MTYFSKTRYEFMVDHPIEMPDAVVARASLNRKLDHIHHVIRATGLHPVITWTPPPAVGGYVQQIDLYLNLFQLFRYQISNAFVFDFIERAIGIYEANRRAAFWRMFNPLYYLRWALELVGGIPAALLGMLGFDRSRVEGSIAGKVLRGIVEVVTLIAGVLTILALLDWMEPVKAFIAARL
ncbi:MAG TPA: hypothetical protein VEZ88_13310 [Steroidobacteraceae bacterium]|nr:hypothetical protein [Steroidobacteraceae bacterium]